MKHPNDLKLCYHCNEDLSLKSFKSDKKEFCCRGCLRVYEILHANGLDEYYKVKDHQVGGKPKEELTKFSYLDNSQFIDEYYEVIADGYRMRFYVEGVHCSACLWLLERLSDFGIGVITSHLNMGTSILTIDFYKTSKLSIITNRLKDLGYCPHPILGTDDSEILMQEENKRELIRIAFAFACAGNIMLYSFSVYFGAELAFTQYFNFFSFLCSIPIVLYCAIPFYKSALASIESRVASIDIPIVIVIILTFVLGGLSLFSDLDIYYFDTISILVFLLLSSRYLLKLVQRKTMNLQNISNHFLSSIAKRITNGSNFDEILAKYLNVGDKVLVKAGDTLPADGIVLSGESYLNNSVLTGESRPSKVVPSDKVFLGATNLDKDLTIEVISQTSDSRISKIMQELELSWGNDTSLGGLIDKITKYFTVILLVLALSFFCYFYFSAGLEIAFSRTFALLLITCPCALALSAPLALTIGLASLLKEGIFVKSEAVLEKLLYIEKVFFDKTGTLTDGKFEINFSQLDEKYIDLLYSIELKSTHPIAISIVKSISEMKTVNVVEIDEFYETPGIGPTAKIAGATYEIRGNSAITNKKIISIIKDGIDLGQLEIEDKITANADLVVSFFKKKKIIPAILSGDTKQRVFEVADALLISRDDCFDSFSPEEKVSIVSTTANSMMVGDGMNDSLAIRKATVGVAVSGGVESSLKASDVYFSNNSLTSLIKLFKSADIVNYTIKRNLLFSLIYNVLGVYFAFFGIVSPIVAAIFMPISSLTVILSTVYSLRKLRNMTN